ncbi:MAG: hypothetical protein A2234_11600 [Elusimicrobia bacterium RIFOXYA2_FULL_58_8]|nr:MAG: hypothetical protein A2234_11600 [Elusimicrobia bacterium RIFOXYA2_FULL_58_8]
MKHLLASILLLTAAWPAGAEAPKTYGDAQNDLAWLSHSVSFHRKTLGAAIKDQTSNLEVRRRLEHAKATVEEMIQRDNISKACKVVEVTATVATVGVGGIALAATKGLSVATREGAAIAAKYMLKEGAKEAGKEALGIPGYSDAVKAGVFIFNNYDQNEMQGQLSRDNMELLLKAKSLLEDDSDGRTLKDKLPELRQLLSESEDRLEQNGYKIKAADKLINEAKAEAGKLYQEAQRLKALERKEDEKRAAEAKAAKDKELPTPQVSKPAAVPPPASDPKESQEEKRRKMQEAITKYISSLGASIERSQKAADAAWKDISDKPRQSTRYYVSDEIQDLLAGLAYGEEGLGTSRTYAMLQGVERSAENTARSIEAQRLALETQKAEIKTRIEPLLTDIAGHIAQWRSAGQLYKPQGYYVPESPKLEGMTVWSAYYETPLKYAEGYLNGTDGLASKYTALASRARGLKNALYAQVSEFMAGYAEKLQAYKNYQPQVAGQLEKLTAETARHNEVLNALGSRFISEFAYDGKYDLANLEAALAAAKPAFSEAQRLNAAGALLYRDLYGRYDELKQLEASPLVSEASWITYSAEDKGHKAGMAAAEKRTQGYAPDLKGTEGWEEARDAGAEIIFEAEAALRYLKAQEARLVAAYARGASAFKANTAGDLSGLGALPDAQYGAAIEKLFAPVQKAEEEKNVVLGEVRKAQFWGTEPWAQTGFWTVRVRKASGDLEQATSAFWDSASGKALTDARRVGEIQQSRDRQDPGSALVRKLYEDFARAYSSRDAAKVLALVSPDWGAGDGTTVSELEEQLRAIFRLNDEVTATVSGLSVVNDSQDRYTAYYNLNIKSRIYKKNIKREETSSVSEKVVVEGGRARILKTDAGGYWEIK